MHFEILSLKFIMYLNVYLCILGQLLNSSSVQIIHSLLGTVVTVNKPIFDVDILEQLKTGETTYGHGSVVVDTQTTY